ncbi:TetR/AcrR family transcriptional regulator [Heyndrickxia camelliae]|uniref:TetR/AcrR family transcriptional regulator n=1 Tax=Heyndrickxia camelliae TaxID=1707093 RepID=A0A2N3LJ65_9BACI|nr:TetR/AcrR family transcriptional regulator [Heyndrickxia camelliae]PKR84646.1 TetR/AcrR family transcriptional regulator [Heyndrickxia camelliae]
MSNNIHLDRRIAKSKQALKDALISLMQKKDFKEITIKEIVQLADLNRGTFYKHYQYKEDLLEEMMDDVIANLILSYREPYKNKETFEVKELTSSTIKIFDHVDKYKEFYTLVVQSNAMLGFQSKICDVLKELVLHDLYDHRPEINIAPNLHASFQAYAIFGMIVEWIQQGFKYSSTYMAEQLLAIIKYSQVNAVVKLHIKE